MQADPTPIPAPDHAAEERRRDSLDQQVRFVGQRTLQLEQRLLDIEHQILELDRTVEESRATPRHELLVKDREAKALDRLGILESIAADKKEIDVLKAQRAFVG
jgi:hypothetical protein